MSKYEGGILSIALAKLASGELRREEELERQERAFDDLVWRHVTYRPAYTMYPSSTAH
jgi:hypothetical protein